MSKQLTGNNKKPTMFSSTRFVITMVCIIAIFVLAVLTLIFLNTGEYIGAALTGIPALGITFVTGKSSSKFAAKWSGGTATTTALECDEPESEEGAQQYNKNLNPPDENGG